MRPYLALQRAASLLLFAIMIVSFMAIGVSAAADGNVQPSTPLFNNHIDLTDGIAGVVDDIVDGIVEFFEGMFDSLWNDISESFNNVGDKISGVVDTVTDTVAGVTDAVSAKADEIKTFFTETVSSIFDGLGEKIGQFVLSVFFPGTKDLVDLIEDGGVSHVSSDFNKAISSIYDLFMPLGCFIMVISWLFGVAKSAVTLNLDIQGKEGIIRSGLSLIVGVMFFEVSMQAMEGMSGLCWEYCDSISKAAAQAGLPKDLSSFFATDPSVLGTPLARQLGYAFISWITEAVLLLNLAYMGLLQCISPVFIGFAAGGEGSRRFVAGFFKEYFKVCLIPPVIAIYVTLCFELFRSSGVGLFLGIVLGVSIFSISKKLDRLIG